MFVLDALTSFSLKSEATVALIKIRYQLFTILHHTMSPNVVNASHFVYACFIAAHLPYEAPLAELRHPTIN